VAVTGSPTETVVTGLPISMTRPRELVPKGNKLYGTMPRVCPTGEVQSGSTDAGPGNGDPHILRTQGERLALDQPQVSRTKQIG
jgi:hypothetical protein